MPPKAATAQPTTLQQRVVTLVQHPQFIWFAGHCLHLACSLRYLLAFVTFSASKHGLAFKASFVGALLTYGIVTYKTFSNPKTRGPIDLQLALKLWTDENVQYFLLAAYWLFISKPIVVALLPYTIFSVFHFLTYLRASVVPAFDETALQENAQTTSARFCRITNSWIKQNYERAMALAARIELLVVGGRVLLGVLTWQLPFHTLAMVGAFLRYRYSTSAFTRTQFSQLALTLDHAVADPRVPAPVKQGWQTIRGLVSQYLGRMPASVPQNAGAASQERKTQ
ncbi:hypothetical protein BCR37DRAFT_142612 [Protomyces lactucae-debilis]|uniref:Endoplasmic reticulum protein n=1 Tax=Protomyces lactucae-debilis TaxID=2754530 RepID=A0A1Y2FUU2_PROLT|nr:uncharacterized protein BCR37DRAFT_142612 [Protomyces lactucae-debilis]ORY87054.1 hypothetical protein BCR37DRAFT_142612 [Protomyces lactucae-debilis]